MKTYPYPPTLLHLSQSAISHHVFFILLQESDEDDYDEEEEDGLEEKGQDWDEMEREVSSHHFCQLIAVSFSFS